ncbi:hypothetical protein CF328_g9526, partial [Tilletia controversa]
ASRRPRHSSRSDALWLFTAATAVITFVNQAQHWLNKDAFQNGLRVVRISTRACSVCVLPPRVFKMADSIDSLLPHDHHHHQQHHITTPHHHTTSPHRHQHQYHISSSNSTATTATSTAVTAQQQQHQ